MKKRKNLDQVQGERIPSETDWKDYLRDDLDQKHAYQVFFGKSNLEVQQQFRNTILGAVEDLRFMPEIPFRYYMLGFRDYVMSGDFGPYNSASATSCFLDLMKEKLEKEPRTIIPIMEDLLPAADFVAHHQMRYGANVRIFGSFLRKLNEIQKLYAESKGRYRNFR